MIDLGCIVPPSLFAVLVELSKVAREALITLGYPVQLLLGYSLSVWITIADFQVFNQPSKGG